MRYNTSHNTTQDNPTSASTELQRTRLGHTSNQSLLYPSHLIPKRLRSYMAVY